jgi:hypothetical protein
MKKLLLLLLILPYLAIAQSADATPIENILLTNVAKNNNATRVIVQDSITKELKFVLKSTLNTNISIGNKNANTFQLLSSTGSGPVVPQATTTEAGLMIASDKTKINSLATGATANSTDAQLRDRTTHTGVQAIATVTGLQSALDGKQNNLGFTPYNATNPSGFTANSTDAQLRDRTTHTGTQLSSTISDIQSTITNNTSVLANTAKVSYSDAAKVSNITVTQAVNLDTMESNITTNNAKVGITTTQSSNIVTNNAKISFDNTSSTRLANTSGTNTGDNATNTQYSGLVSNATHTGDVTGSTALTLATVNSNIGTFNNVAVNNKGLVTSASNVTYATGSGSATGLNTGDQDLTGKVDKVTGSSLIPETSIARLSNTSGTNTGDNATNTQYSGLATSKENTITAGTTSQYFRGDKTFQTLNKTAVGLANVDNTSDLNKPISTATQTALNLKANLAGGNTFTGTQNTLSGIVKVGNRPVSTRAISFSASLNDFVIDNTVNGHSFEESSRLIAATNNASFGFYDNVPTITSLGSINPGHFNGFQSRMRYEGSADFLSGGFNGMNSFYSDIFIAGSGNVSATSGLYIQNSTVTGTGRVLNQYGVIIGNLNAGTVSNRGIACYTYRNFLQGLTIGSDVLDTENPLRVEGNGKFTGILKAGGSISSGTGQNNANNFTVDNNQNNISRLYSNGKDVSTNGDFEFYTTRSNGTNQVTALSIKGNGKVGFNQPNPTEVIDVVGNGKFSGTVTASASLLTQSSILYRPLLLNGSFPSTNIRSQNLITFQGTDTVNSDPFDDVTGESTKNFHIGTVSDIAFKNSNRFSIVQGGIERLSALMNGFVGINQPNPTERLDVVGNGKFSGTVTASPATVSTQLATLGQVRPYKIYVALLTQTGSSAPVATILENTLGGTVVWSRSVAGLYLGTLNNTFVIDKVLCLSTVSPSEPALIVSSSRSTVDRVQVRVTNAGEFTDNITNLNIEIRVYN